MGLRAHKDREGSGKPSSVLKEVVMRGCLDYLEMSKLTQRLPTCVKALAFHYHTHDITLADFPTNPVFYCLICLIGPGP